MSVGIWPCLFWEMEHANPTWHISTVIFSEDNMRKGKRRNNNHSERSVESTSETEDLFVQAG